MSDSYSDDDYEPIAVTSWGDQTRKEVEPTRAKKEEEKEEEKIKKDWSTLLDPNAKVSETGLGSGGLHRQGKNYRPVDETLILQQRLSGASLKTEEEKKQHKEKNVRMRRKIDRYAKELKEDRPVSQKFLSSSSPSKKPNSTRFSSSSNSRPRSTTKKSSFSSLSSTASSTSFTTRSSITTISQSSSSSSASTTEKSNNVPLALYRQTAPWDAEYPDDHEGSLSLAEPPVSSSIQQQSKKKGSVSFSHPLEQPPPITLHSPQMQKAIPPSSSTTDTTLGSASTSSSPTTITSDTAVSTKNPSHSPPSITKTSVDRTRSTSPASAPGSTTNPWLNGPLIDEPFWSNRTKTINIQNEEKGKNKTDKEDDDKLVEDVEPQQLQRLDTVAASKWTSSNMLTPFPITTPTKKRQPPIWEPPESADWFKMFEPSKTEKDDRDNHNKTNNNGVTDDNSNLSSSPSVTNKDDDNQQADAPPPKHQQLEEQVTDRWQSPSTPPTSLKDTGHCQSSVSFPPATISPRLVSSPPNFTSSSSDTAPTQVTSSPTSSAEFSHSDTGLQTAPASVQGSLNSTSTRPVISQPSNWQTASNTLATSTTAAPTPATFNNAGGNTWANSPPKSRQDSTNASSNSSSSAWNDISSNDNTWKDTSKSWTNGFNNESATTSWGQQSSWNNNNDATNTWGSNSSNSSWDSSFYNQQEQQQTVSGGSYSSGKTSRFSRPDRPKYSTRQKGPRPANYRPGQPITPPAKVAPPSRLENPVIISINVELGPNKKIPVQIHQFDDPQTLAQHFANEHSIRSRNIVAALYQLFSTQKFQAMKRRGRPM